MENLVGLKIRIIDMQDEPQYNGREGIVLKVSRDFSGDWMLHGTWGGLAVFPKVDKIKIL